MARDKKKYKSIVDYIHMVTFTTQIEDKKNYIGWVHIIVPSKIAAKIHPEDKRGFRVKGKIDDYTFNGIGLLPAGEGDYFMALNATIRKKLMKRPGDKVTVQLEQDEAEYILPELFTSCLKDEPEALDFFQTLSKGHQRYYGNWIDTAKTEDTKIKRVAEAISALYRKQHFGQMMQFKKVNKYG